MSRGSGAPLTGSDIPVPRLSNRINRANDPKLVQGVAEPGHLPLELHMRDEAGHKDEVERPLARHLVGDMDVAASARTASRLPLSGHSRVRGQPGAVLPLHPH